MSSKLLACCKMSSKLLACYCSECLFVRSLISLTRRPGITPWSLITDQSRVLKRMFWQLWILLWMVLPAVWRSVGCGERVVSLRRGARTGAGVVAAAEWRTGSKKSFLLSTRQTVRSILWINAGKRAEGRKHTSPWITGVVTMYRNVPRFMMNCNLNFICETGAKGSSCCPTGVGC